MVVDFQSVLEQSVRNRVFTNIPPLKMSQSKVTKHQHTEVWGFSVRHSATLNDLQKKTPWIPCTESWWLEGSYNKGAPVLIIWVRICNIYENSPFALLNYPNFDLVFNSSHGVMKTSSPKKHINVFWRVLHPALLWVFLCGMPALLGCPNINPTQNYPYWSDQVSLFSCKRIHLEGIGPSKCIV